MKIKESATILQTIRFPIAGRNTPTLPTVAWANPSRQVFHRPPQYNLPRRDDRRGIVTTPTFRLLTKHVGRYAAVDTVPPYQRHGGCLSHAINVLNALRARSQGTSPPPSDEPAVDPLGKLHGLWLKFKGAASGEYQFKNMGHANSLLRLYNEKGPFMFHAPGLGKGYADHALTVFAVLNVSTKTGVKIVLCAMDSSDVAADPQTTASREMARKCGKAHVSELSHEEANLHEADRRRIRFIDVESLTEHIWRTYLRYQNSGVHEIATPGVAYLKKGIDGLTPLEAQELRTLLERIYETDEVEKF